MRLAPALILLIASAALLSAGEPGDSVEPVLVRLGPLTLNPSAFLELIGMSRSATTADSVSTHFGNIPLEDTPGESLGSPRHSRLMLKGDLPAGPFHFSAYLERLPELYPRPEPVPVAALLGAGTDRQLGDPGRTDLEPAAVESCGHGHGRDEYGRHRSGLSCWADRLPASPDSGVADHGNLQGGRGMGGRGQLRGEGRPGHGAATLRTGRLRGPDRTWGCRRFGSCRRDSALPPGDAGVLVPAGRLRGPGRGAGGRQRRLHPAGHRGTDQEKPGSLFLRRAGRSEEH